jgi:hypothetical protein
VEEVMGDLSRRSVLGAMGAAALGGIVWPWKPKPTDIVVAHAVPHDDLWKRPEFHSFMSAIGAPFTIGGMTVWIDHVSGKREDDGSVSVSVSGNTAEPPKEARIADRVTGEFKTIMIHSGGSIDFTNGGSITKRTLVRV